MVRWRSQPFIETACYALPAVYRNGNATIIRRSNISDLPATSLKGATNHTGNSGASSNDRKRIQTNNLAPTPQPMTAALIFWRQLVRPRALNL
jgi:hypothetical protein